MIELHERIGLSPARVDEAAGVLRGVRILGSKSRNGRRYTPAALADTAQLVEGTRVFLDHDREGQGRSVRDLVGTLSSGRVSGNAVLGDLKLLRSHPHARAVLEAAALGLDGVGLSIHGQGNGKPDESGTMVIESMGKLRSVDVVLEPATSSTFFLESRRSKTPPTRREADSRVAGRPNNPQGFRGWLRDEPKPPNPDALRELRSL